MTVIITRGFEPSLRPVAAGLYWQAFGGKLGRVMQPEALALAHVARVMRPDHAFAALDPAGHLVGIAGFRSLTASFVGGSTADLRDSYGRLGGTLRGLMLSLLSQDVDNERFLVDGIAVRADRRGEGIGTRLVEALCAEAQARGYRQIRLDVVGGNVRARQLYERAGFATAARSRSRATAVLFGFDSVTTMVRPL